MSKPDTTQDLDEVLAKHGAEPGEMTHSLKQAILDWHNKQTEEIIGDGEVHVSHVCPRDNADCIAFNARNQLRHQQRSKLKESK